MEPFEPRETKSSTGPIVSIVIILLLVLFGGIYFWQVQQRKAQSLPHLPNSGATTSTTTIQ